MPGKSARLELSREQILAYRREASSLNERLPASAKSLPLAAWAGLQDSMPRGCAVVDPCTGQGMRFEFLGASVSGPALGSALQQLCCSREGSAGDVYFLLWGSDRELLVPDPKRRAELWTTRVWPGAFLVNGEITGVWRRSGTKISIDTWRRLSSPEWEVAEAEAATLPLPGLNGPITIHRSLLFKTLSLASFLGEVELGFPNRAFRFN